MYVPENSAVQEVATKEGKILFPLHSHTDLKKSPLSLQIQRPVDRHICMLKYMEMVSTYSTYSLWIHM